MKLELFQKKIIKEDKIDIYYREMTPLIQKLVNIVDCTQNNPNINGKNGDGEQVIINIKDIFYFESVDKRVFAYLKNNVYQLNSNLNQLEIQFKKDGFVRINKSNIVNIFKIERIKPEINMRIRAIMSNDENLIINRSYKKEFRNFLKERRSIL